MKETQPHTPHHKLKQKKVESKNLQNSTDSDRNEEFSQFEFGEQNLSTQQNKEGSIKIEQHEREVKLFEQKSVNRKNRGSC